MAIENAAHLTMQDHPEEDIKTIQGLSGYVVKEHVQLAITYDDTSVYMSTVNIIYDTCKK